MTNTSDQQEIERLLQKEWREQVIPNLGDGQWIRVYQRSSPDNNVRLDISSAIIPNNYVHKVLDSHSWDTSVFSFAPSFERLLDEESNEIILNYYRFSNRVGVEPLVIERSFHQLKPKNIEILEEFRLFHNLYFEPTNSTFVKFDDSGDEVDVVRIRCNYAEVKRKHIRQFLTARNMSLVVYFDRMYFSHLKIKSTNEDGNLSVTSGNGYTYGFRAAMLDWKMNEKYISFSRVYGKRIVKGLPPNKIGIAAFDEEVEKDYEEFIIGVNDDDEQVFYTANPDDLANYFGKNPYAPNFLTPIFFSRSVLHKYYSEPTKFSVGDGCLYCNDLWSIPIDNNHPEYVIVFLGYLGEKLPYREQSHWKLHNVAAKSVLSETSWRRWFQQEGAAPMDSALRFQYTFANLLKAWQKQYGWHLFKPLSEADTHHFSKLRRPLTNEITEFHGIVVSISILLQDRIDKKALGKHIPDFEPKNADKAKKGNIPVLGEYLESQGFPDSEHYVEYLRMLQVLRSNCGKVHPRNEKACQKAERFFSLDSKSTIQVADDIFTTLTEFLDSLRAHFCPRRNRLTYPAASRS